MQLLRYWFKKTEFEQMINDIHRYDLFHKRRLYTFWGKRKEY